MGTCDWYFIGLVFCTGCDRSMFHLSRVPFSLCPLSLCFVCIVNLYWKMPHPCNAFFIIIIIIIYYFFCTLLKLCNGVFGIWEGDWWTIMCFFFPTTSPKYREINLQETKKKTKKQKNHCSCGHKYQRSSFLSSSKIIVIWLHSLPN